MEMFARTTILLCKHMKYSNSLILFSLESLEVLLFTETGSRSNTRSLIMQAHSPLCKQLLINSKYCCNTEKSSVKEEVKPYSAQGQKAFLLWELSLVLQCAGAGQRAAEGALCPTPPGHRTPQ